MNKTKRNEILSILQEECAEVVQSVSKIFRFGDNETWKGQTNREHLVTEIGDVVCIISLLVENQYITEKEIVEAAESKLERLKKWAPRVVS